MSDGNYNRSLLPHTPYQSGMKTGKAMAKMKAVEAFKEYLIAQRQNYTLSENEWTLFLASEVEKFKIILERKIQ